MNKFKALLIKDWHISKKSLMMPFWITAAFYILILLAVAVAYFRGEIPLAEFKMEADMAVPAIIYAVNLALYSLPGFMMLIFTITITQSALNEDVRKNCELFHRSQPVSVWWRSLSKYTLGIAGNWAVLLVIAVFNYIVINSVLAAFGQTNFYASFSAFAQGFLSFAKIGLLLGSLTFFCSAVFKDKAFFQGVAILLGVNFLFMILNVILGWHLPSPLKYLMDLFTTTSLNKFSGDPGMIDLPAMIDEIWKKLILNWKTLLQIGVSGALFATATLIYNNKEVK